MPIIDGEYQAPDIHTPGPASAPEPQPVQLQSQRDEVTPLAKSLVDTIKGLNTKVDASLSNAALLADPQIRAYLEAKQAGRPVQLTEVKAPEPVQPSEPEFPTDLETMSQTDLAKFLVKTFATQTQNMLKSTVSEQVGSLRNELGQRLDGMATIEANRMQQTAAQQVAEFAKEKPDFETLRPHMAELAKVTQGLSISDLYNLTKLRMGVPPVTQNEISSERPGVVPGSQRIESQVKHVARPGVQGFRESLAHALSKRT